MYCYYYPLPLPGRHNKYYPPPCEFTSISNNLNFKISFITLLTTTILHSVVVSTLDSQSRGLGSNLSQGKKIFFSQNAQQEVERSTGSVDLKQFAKNRGKIIIRWIK